MVKVAASQAILIFIWGIIIAFVCSVGSDILDHAPQSFCDYCAIANHTTKVRILDETEHLMAFKSKEPDCYKHYIIMPKEHIKNVYAENATCEIIQEMVKLCKNMMDEEGIAQGRRMIFNNPPFYNVKHLHLNCMACNKADDSFINPQFYFNEFLTFASPRRIEECLNNFNTT